MKRQEHTGKAEEEFAAEAHRLLSQSGEQDTADWAPAVAAAIKTASAGRGQPEIPPSWIVPPGLPNPRLPGVGPLPSPSSSASLARSSRNARMARLSIRRTSR